MDPRPDYHSDHEGEEHTVVGSPRGALREMPSARRLLRDRAQRRSESIRDANLSRTTVATQEQQDRESDGMEDVAHEGLKRDDPETKPKMNMVLILLGLILAVMCMALDQSILGTATPKITAEFKSLSDIGWYGSAYLLTTCCFQLMFGKLYNEFNIKWVFLSAVVIFEIGSTICAASPNSMTLIVGRAVAGLGAAGILTGALLIIALNIPLADRPKFTGIVGGCSSIAQVIAPFLGGVFTDKLSWRWCFWINLPLGGVTIVIVTLFLKMPDREQATKKSSFMELLKKFDFVGTLVLFPSIICLLMALQWGGTIQPWNNWRVVLLLCVFSICIVAWFIIQWRLGDSATVPFRIAGQRSIAAAMWYSFFFSGFVFTVTQYVPIYFQAVKDVSAYQSGINFLAASGAMAVMALFSGFITIAFGYYNPPMYIANTLMSIAAGLVFRFWLDTSTAYWVGALVLFGLAAGLGGQQSLMVPQTILSGGDISIGTSMIIFSQTISGTIFLSVGNNVLGDKLVSSLKAHVPQVDPSRVLAAGAGDLAKQMHKIYPKYVHKIIPAYGEAMQAVFLVGLILAVLSILGTACVEWKSIKGDKDKEKGATMEMVMV